MSREKSQMILNKINVSLVICVYTEKRWDDICAAVESCRNQTTPPQEIIVSVDHNPRLYERVRQNMPDVIVVENTEQPGLSGARNSGIRVARGDVIAYLDDDAVASHDWLERLTYCLEDQLVMGAGGVVEPRWEEPPPTWFPKEFNWVIGCSYRGLPDKTAPIRNLFGGCMCIRREIFDEVGYFRSGIGRTEKRPMGCEETELCIRANQHWPDRLFLYEPRAWAFHRVPANRGTWKYFINRCYSEGISKAMVTQEVGIRDGLSSERSYTLHTLPRGVMRGIKDVIVRRDITGAGRVAAIFTGLAATTAGYVVGIITQMVSRKDKPGVFPRNKVETSIGDN